jgi:hypothetical protein
MNTSTFHSALAEPLGQFVQYKRALNRKYHTEAAALRLLDRYHQTRFAPGNCLPGAR